VDDPGRGGHPRYETARVEPLQIVTPRSLFVTSCSVVSCLRIPARSGPEWKRPYVITQQGGKPVNAQVARPVAGWEHVIVPAGEFDALRIRDSYLDDEEFWRWGTRAYQTDWYAPAVGRFVRHEEKSAYYEKSGRWPDNERRGDWTVLELQSYEAGS
jgi:hypothetical protein